MLPKEPVFCKQVVDEQKQRVDECTRRLGRCLHLPLLASPGGEGRRGALRQLHVRLGAGTGSPLPGHELLACACLWLSRPKRSACRIRQHAAANAHERSVQSHAAATAAPTAPPPHRHAGGTGECRRSSYVCTRRAQRRIVGFDGRKKAVVFARGRTVVHSTLRVCAEKQRGYDCARTRDFSRNLRESHKWTCLCVYGLKWVALYAANN